MDLPRPSFVSQLALLKQLALHLSPEGRGFAYLLADHASGAVLRLNRAAAISYARFARAATGDAAARTALSEEDARTGFMTLQMTAQVRRSAEQGPKAFNPLSVHMELFDIGPLQRPLQGLARWVFGPVGAIFLGMLALLAFILGSRNDWSAATAFQTSITLEALLTFGLLAPILKVIHELGHVLAATRAGVRVRMAGLNLIAFYPMPFVDCSEADLTAQRGQRIMISAAGVLTDFAIGLTAFCLWHVTENGQTQDILGYVFVFSTLNSLLFNANPLMRMDGYFAVSDALGRRNLATDATAVLRAAVARVRSLGQSGAWPQARAEWAVLAYGAAAAVYRVLILVGILWIVMPQYFGVGIVAALWSAWAMFGAKVMGLVSAPAAPVAVNTADAPATPSRGRVLGKWAGAAGVAALILMFPIAPRVVVELRPDLVNHYNVTNTRAGVLMADLPRQGAVSTGTLLAQLRSTDIADAAELADLGVAEAQIMDAISQGQGAAQIKAGADRVASATTMQAIAGQEQAALMLVAARDGMFTAAAPMARGTFLRQGSVIGSVVPQTGPIVLTGTFPEEYVIHFDQGVRRARLWIGTQYRTLDTGAVRLIEEAQQDAATMTRGFTLRLETSATGMNPYPQVRLAFTPIAVWRHMALWGNRKLAQFRDSQLAETERRIEN